MLQTPAVLLSLLAAVSGFSICYEPDLCVPVIPPYSGSPQRPVLYIPADPTVRFFLYNPADLDHPKELFKNSSSISSSWFNPKLKTYFIIHGYTLTAHERIIIELSKAIQGAEECNVITVDWGSVSWTPYMQAVLTAQIIGKKIAHFIRCIEDSYGYSGLLITLIGHSLGAHIAGFAGYEYKNIWRIVCLDPAGPGFYQVAEEARLSRKSAKFVHCFHTNAGNLAELRLGYAGALGHMDILMNGGSRMPECLINIPALLEKQAKCLFGAITGPVGCPNIFPSPEECEPVTGFLTLNKELMKLPQSVLACDHMQAFRYYINSIHNPKNYLGQPCSSFEKCQQGETEPCPPWGCPQVGHNAEAPTDGDKIYYVRTPLLTAVVNMVTDLVGLTLDAADLVLEDPATAVDIGVKNVEGVVGAVVEDPFGVVGGAVDTVGTAVNNLLG